jgi:hypothetical protein
MKYFIFCLIAKTNFTSVYILAHLGFFIHFFYESPNNLPLWDFIKTHRGASHNQKFDMKTMIFLKMYYAKTAYKNFSYPTIPVKANQIFVRLSL